MRRVLGEQLRVDVGRSAVLADAAQEHRLQVAIAGVPGILRQQLVELGEAPRRFVAAVQQEGVVVARGREAGRELQAALEERDRVVAASAARRDLGEHADRRHVGRRLHQVRLQEPLGARKVVLHHRRRGLDQRGVPVRVADVPEVRGVRRLGVADGHQVVAEEAPGLGVVGAQVDGAAERLDRLVAPAAAGERLRKQEGGGRMAGHDLQDFARLLGGEFRAHLQQPPRVLHRDVQRAGRACVGAHGISARRSRAIPSWMSATP